MCSDQTFQSWTHRQVELTLGPVHTSTAQPQTISQPALDPTTIMWAMAAQFGAQMATMMQATGNGGATCQPQPQQRAEDLGKKTMDKDLLATIMGFSGVTDPSDVTMVRRKWQRTSKFRTHRKDLIRGIKAWSQAVGIEVDLCLFFTKQQTEDFTSGNFNPGDCLAQFVSCDRGVSILLCMSMSLTQQEKHKSRETAEGESKSNRSLTKALQLKYLNLFLL